MKKSFLSLALLVVIVLLSGCPSDKGLAPHQIPPGEKIRSNSFISQYTTFDSIDIRCIYRLDSFSIYFWPEFSWPYLTDYNIFSQGEGAQEFDKLAAKHNDTTYKGLIRYLVQPRYIMFENHSTIVDIESISVTSTEDWDEAHPAGTQLNDLITYAAAPIQQFINSNYDKEKYLSSPYGNVYRRNLAEMTGPKDFYLALAKGIILEFGTVPQTERVQHFTVTLTFDDGTVITKNTAFYFGKD